jgi:hypothetical protein
MLAEGIRKQARRDNSAGLSDEKIARYRSYLSNSVLSEGICALSPGFAPFQGLSWDYFLADVALEARAAHIMVPRSWSAEWVSDTIKLLPPTAMARRMAARFVYFSPEAPENEAQVDYLVQALDAATVRLMRQRRHAVHALQAIEARREEARKEADARETSFARNGTRVHIPSSAPSPRTFAAGSRFRPPTPGMSSSRAGIIIAMTGMM